MSGAPLRPPSWPLVDVASGIHLRPWREADAPALAAAWAVPDIAGPSAPPGEGGLDDAVRWIAGADDRDAVDLVVAPGDAADVVWGEVGLAPLLLRSGDRRRTEVEVGWWILPDQRRRGRASAAAALVVDWALGEGGLARVVARISRGHVASEAVAGHAGLARLGRLDADRDLWAASGPRPGREVGV